MGCAYTLSFTVQQTFIQIIHDKNHWIIVSNIGIESTDTAIVDVYDSLNRDLYQITQIACIV